MRPLVCNAVLLALLCCFVRAQTTTVAQPPPADQVVTSMVAKNAERAARLRSYSSVRQYTLDYRGFPSGRHANMRVRAVLENGQKRLEIIDESGSKLLRDRVLRKLIENESQADSAAERASTALNLDNYSFHLVGTELAGDRMCYVLDVTPRRSHRLLYVGRIWVDAREYALVRIDASPAKNPSFWITETRIEHEYAKFGLLWLPAHNHSVSKIRLGGEAVLDIDYGRYDVIEENSP